MGDLLAPWRRRYAPKQWHPIPYGCWATLQDKNTEDLKRIETPRRRIDPFHVPTELADGLGVESLPRLPGGCRFLSISALATPCRFAPAAQQSEKYFGSSRSDAKLFIAPHWVLRAARWQGGLGGQAGEYSKNVLEPVNHKLGSIGIKSKKILMRP